MVLPLIDRTAVYCAPAVVFEVEAAVDVDDAARAVTHRHYIPMIMVGFRHVAPLVHTVPPSARLAPLTSRSKPV